MGGNFSTGVFSGMSDESGFLIPCPPLMSSIGMSGGMPSLCDMIPILVCKDGMLLMSSSSVVVEEVDFFRDGEPFIFPPPEWLELGDPGEAMLDEPKDNGEKTGWFIWSTGP